IDDRRAFVLKVSDHKAKDTAYFGAIRDEMANGGRAALLAYLLARPVSRDLLRRIPATAALRANKDLSLNPVDSFVLDALERGTPITPLPPTEKRPVVATHDGQIRWDGVQVMTHEWYADFTQHVRGTRVTYRSFSMRLAKLIKGEAVQVSGPRGYKLASLD